jgi:hypothetical protein
MFQVRIACFLLVSLLSSGFEMQSRNRAQVELTQPQSLSLKNGASGQLVGRVDPVKSANMYEGRIKPIDGDWLPSVFTGDSQHIIFDGLTRVGTRNRGIAGLTPVFDSG